VIGRDCVGSEGNAAGTGARDAQDGLECAAAPARNGSHAALQHGPVPQDWPDSRISGAT